MIDPITALTAASSAYSLIKKGFAAGREIESMTGDLSKWMGAISDIRHAEKQTKNPPLFKKLFNGSSVEQEAMDAFAAKKKAEAMEEELRNWINLTHGPKAWSDLLKMQAKIRKDRQEQIYAQQEARKKVMNIIGLIFAFSLLAVAASTLFYVIVTGLQADTRT